jgi:hypothetical protein
MEGNVPTTPPVPPAQTGEQNPGSDFKPILLSGLVVLIVLLFGGVIFFDKLKPLFQTPTAYPKIDAKVTCAKFKDLNFAIQNIKVACILDLSNQNLSSLPAGVAKLTNLNQIILNKNNFTTIPKELTSLSSITEIDIADNKISQIPDYMADFKRLSALDLTGNPVVSNQVEMRKLSAIRFVIVKK